MEWLQGWFSESGFMPHGHCYLWTPSLVWTMVSSDMLIGLAYMWISVTLYLLIRRIRLPFSGMFLAFGLFIAACGATHFMEVWTLWQPHYWLAAFMKVITALASIATAVYLVRVQPEVVELAQVAKEVELTHSKIEEFYRTSLMDVREFGRLMRKTLILPLLLSLLLASLSIAQVFYLIRANSWVDRSDSSLTQAYKVQRLFVEAENDLRGYLLSGKAEFREDFQTTEKSLGLALDFWSESVSEGSDSSDRIREIRKEMMTTLRQAAEAGRSRVAQQMADQKAAAERIRELFDEFFSEENELREAQRQKTQWVLGFFVLTLATLALVMGSVLALSGRRSLRKLSAHYGHALDTERRQTAQLQKAVRSRDEFMTIASHELRTPLTSMQLHVQMFRRVLETRGESQTVTVDRMKGFALQAERQVRRLNRLVDDMLDVSRITSGRFTVMPEPMDLSEVVLDVCDRLSVLATEDKIVIQCQADLPVFGVWDRFRIEQVIINLLTNAIKYGAGSPVKIAVWQEDDEACFSVSDQGRGIAPEDQKRIFERFERAISATEVSGFGLGLSIAQEIVKLHQGAISVESQIGQGATFIVRLPLKAFEEERAET